MKEADKTISRLAKSNNRSNHTRSILIIVSIALTTMLLTMIALIGCNAVKDRRVNAPRMYGGFCGSFTNVSKAQLDKMKEKEEFTEIGLRANAGWTEKNKKTFMLHYIDDTVLKMTLMNEYVETGEFPVQRNEIMAERAFFDELGYQDVKIGDHVILDTRIDQESKCEEHDFVISGLLKSKKTDDQIQSYGALVSEAFYQHEVPVEKQKYIIYFNVSDSVGLNGDNEKEVGKQLALSCGLEDRDVDMNSGYIIFSKDPGTEVIATCGMIAFAVILFAVLVIYNIYHVVLLQKVQEYGRIKAIGATKKQMRRLVLSEGMSLAKRAIPAGLLVGYLFTFIAMKILYSYNSIEIQNYKRVPVFSFPMFLLVVVIVLLTIILALLKPMKIVERISSIEAINYQNRGKKSVGYRKGKKTMGVFSMTLAALKGNRKRNISTILTMGLSCVAFVVIVNITSNMDAEYEARKNMEYGQFCVRLDYALNDKAYPENNLYEIQKQNPLNEDLLQKIEELPGVTEVRMRRVLCVKDPNEKDNNISVAVMNRDEFNEYKEALNESKELDYDEVSKNGQFIYGSKIWLAYSKFQVGEQYQLQLYNNNDTTEMKAVLQGAFDDCNEDLVITEDIYNKLNLSGNHTTYVWIDCRKNSIKSVEQSLNSLVKNENNLRLSSFHQLLKESKTAMRTLSGACYIFLIILGVIGFMNMANTIITSIVTRKREFGVLQAVGLTSHQLNWMLQLEGLLFSLGTILIACVIGCPLGYRLFCIEKEKGFIGLNVYHFPALQIGGIVLVLMTLQIVLAFALSRNIKKESLVERINYIG